MLQLEYYFSRENLARDTFLVNQMNAEAFAPVALVAGFAKMKAYTTDMSLILEAIKESSKLELDEADRSLIRMVHLQRRLGRRSGRNPEPAWNKPHAGPRRAQKHLPATVAVSNRHHHHNTAAHD